MSSFGFVLLQPLLISYYKYLGMKRAGFFVESGFQNPIDSTESIDGFYGIYRPSEEELIEFVIFNKDDIKYKRINFQWIHSKEYRYNGDMYDIVEKSEDDSLFYFYVINDTKEKELEEKFNKKVEQNSTDSKQNKNENNTLKILYSELLKSLKIIPDDNSGLKPNLVFTNYYISAWQDVSTPPPRKS